MVTKKQHMDKSCKATVRWNQSCTKGYILSMYVKFNRQKLIFGVRCQDNGDFYKGQGCFSFSVEMILLFLIPVVG